MWECKWLKYKNYKSAINNANDVVETLNPRDSFCGGKTNASKLEVQNKILRCINICSLYPNGQYFDYYPVGHPNEIYKAAKYNKVWCGLVKCKILPPKNLYHPVLQIKKIN